MQAFRLVQEKAPFMQSHSKKQNHKEKKKKAPTMSSHSNKDNRKKTLPKENLECYLCNGAHKLVDCPTKKAVNKLLIGDPRRRRKSMRGHRRYTWGSLSRPYRDLTEPGVIQSDGTVSGADRDPNR